MKKDADFSEFQRFNTPDGSYTLFLPEEGESYHSVHGAMTESMHVFIENGLKTVKNNPACICETGFGTGLNALLCLEYAHKFNVMVYYESCETRPIHPKYLPVPGFVETNSFLTEAWQQIHDCSWNKIHVITPLFHLKKNHKSLLEFVPENKANVWFHDAFSPKIQPEMWCAEAFNHIARQMDDNGCLVTYSSAGLVKNSLREAGYRIERLKGPPGKKHMLRAFPSPKSV
jgi:tRNA U34 5-methylaminomethyl-2-thiouridine-forming methyltransferase MnmC